MRQGDKDQTVELITKLWPKTDWAKEVQIEFVRRLGSLPIDAEQANAALLNLRMGTKYQIVQPLEVMNALRGATAANSATNQTSGMTPMAETWRQWLERADRKVWYQPLAANFITENEPRAMHWLDIADSLLETRSPIYGGLARRFCEWVANRAREKGWSINASGEAVRRATA